MARQREPEDGGESETAGPLSAHRLDRGEWMNLDGFVIGLAGVFSAFFVMAVVLYGGGGPLAWAVLGGIVAALVGLLGGLVWRSLGYATKVRVYPDGPSGRS